MSTFSVRQLEDKLQTLSNSQQSIQTLSLWIIHHRRSSKQIVEAWERFFMKSDEKKKLTLFYLANDVVQTSRKQGSEFITDFQTTLPGVMANIHSYYPGSNLEKSTLRVLTIWSEREVFPAPFMAQLKKALAASDGAKARPPAPIHSSPDKSPLSPTTPVSRDVKPITPAELIEAINKLEKTLSADAALQARVDALPGEMFNVKMLSTLKDKQSVDERMKQLSEALKLVASWDGRLVAEIEDRRDLIAQLEGCIAYQQQQIKACSDRQKSCREKLQHIGDVKRELNAQKDNFPDLLRPSGGGGTHDTPPVVEPPRPQGIKRPGEDPRKAAKEARLAQISSPKPPTPAGPPPVPPPPPAQPPAAAPTPVTPVTPVTSTPTPNTLASTIAGLASLANPAAYAVAAAAAAGLIPTGALQNAQTPAAPGAQPQPPVAGISTPAPAAPAVGTPPQHPPAMQQTPQAVQFPGQAQTIWPHHAFSGVPGFFPPQQAGVGVPQAFGQQPFMQTPAGFPQPPSFPGAPVQR